MYNAKKMSSSSSAARIQLISRGAQDVYLTGTPRVFLFRAVYHRHTNFAIETVEQTFLDRRPSWGGRAVVRLSNHGDLLHSIVVRATVPQLPTGHYVNGFMHALLEECTLWIGGQRVHTVRGDWLEVQDELTTSSKKRVGYGHVVGKHYLPTNGMPDDQFAREGKPTYRTHMGSLRDVTFFLPIRFYIRNTEWALPLVALRYHPVDISFSFRPFHEVVTHPTSIPTPPAEASLDVHSVVVYLDATERARFADVRARHTYLIEQTQHASFLSESRLPSVATHVDLVLPFQNPVKELVWTVRPEESRLLFDYGEHGSSDERVVRAQLFLDYELWVDQPGKYFRTWVPFQKHTRIPTRHVYAYAFALRPEDADPTGTLNFSRYAHCVLRLWLAPVSSSTRANRWVVNVYAVSFNRLTVTEGMASVGFAW